MDKFNLKAGDFVKCTIVPYGYLGLMKQDEIYEVTRHPLPSDFAISGITVEQTHLVAGKVYIYGVDTWDCFEPFSIKDETPPPFVPKREHDCECGAWKCGHTTKSRAHYSWCIMYKE